MKNIKWSAFLYAIVLGLLLPACKIIKGNAGVEQIQYRNIFVEAGYSQEAITQKIEKTFHQLFFGNKETEAVYYRAGNNANGMLGYIVDVNNNDVRSEGMSYGMMIALQCGNKEIFNALWNWAKTYMYQADSTHPAYGYFSWSLSVKGVPNDVMPAPDGEEYFATALYFASVKWGDSSGIYHYQNEADKITTAMRHRDTITGKVGGRSRTTVNLFDEQAMMVRFTPDLGNANHTDASYHLPAFYEVWARKAPVQDRDFWKKAATASRDYFEKAAHPVTALTPDYGNFDGTAWAAPWRRGSANFSYDAWRSAMNWSVDWQWWKQDKRAIERSNRLLQFFMQEGINAYGHEYTLEGKKISNGHPVGLIACNATAALCASHENRLDFVKALWNSEVPTGKYRYYDAMLMMMALLHCSRGFNAYL